MKKGLILIQAGFTALIAISVCHAKQSNIQLTPAPIAYPFFEPGRFDMKLTGDYLSVEGKDANTDISITGGGFDAAFRYSFNAFIAADFDFGLFGYGGKFPGIAFPFYFGGTLWIPVIEGKADLTGLSMPFSVNMELQPIRKPFSLIFFGGPVWTVDSLTIQTPYHAVPFTGGTASASTKFTQDMTVFYSGAQAGIQVGVPLGFLKLAPYYMVTKKSGTATLTFNSGYQNTQSFVGDTTIDLEAFTTTAMGFDMIVVPWNLSIGALIQQADPTKDQEGFKTTMIQLSWHFRGK
ncbi:MAG: hypothetical protein LHV69_05970 [Elusimicrobia bacterium]|nr:hypothetical protein [Candidatus Obscuribacterium magneticum]